MSKRIKGEASFEADFVIVGAGSAGCVMARRLSDHPGTSVVLLEAGRDDRILYNLSQFRSIINIPVPAGFTRILGDPAIDWRYLTEADPSSGGRQFMIHRGKVLGGTSSINGLLYMRGQAEDFQGWRQLGCIGWDWSDVLPYYRRAERHEDGEGEMHGGDGPLSVATPRHSDPVTDALIQAWHEAGLPIRRNVNGIDQEGVGLVAMTSLRGARHSTAAAYLHRAMRRPNLRVETEALAVRVLVNGGVAQGVQFRRGGAMATARARRSVILCGGAINSPQLLQLSGIGPAALLGSKGIPVLHDSPRVGRNLQDHFSALMSFRMKAGAGGFNPLARGAAFYGQLARYALAGRGLLTLAGAHATAFAKSRPELDLPDLQFFMSPATVDAEQSLQAGRMVLDKAPGFTMAGYVMRPRSRGSVKIRSADPSEPPSIETNYFADSEDAAGTVAAMRWMRRVSQMPALKPYADRELPPSVSANGDEELLECAKASGNTSFHQVGTCAMGPDEDDVTDPQLRVNGIDRLRVVDASIMPRITSGNTNAPVIMIAEKAADMILGH